MTQASLLSSQAQTDQRHSEHHTNHTTGMSTEAQYCPKQLLNLYFIEA